MSSGPIGSRGNQYHSRNLTGALSVGLSLLLTIVLGGVLYLVLYGIPAMLPEEAGAHGNPVPTPAILMVTAMFLVTAGWFLYSVYEFLTADEDQGEGDDGARLERLKAAYAAGELDEEGFERRLSAVDGGGSRRDTEGSAGVRDPDGANSRGDRPGEDLESAADGAARSTANDPYPTPEALLRHRFAEGELDEAEFTRNLELLRKTESEGETD